MNILLTGWSIIEIVLTIDNFMPCHSYTLRKKVRRRLFKKFGHKQGLIEYQKYVDELWRNKYPLVGTLEEIINSAKKS